MPQKQLSTKLKHSKSLGQLKMDIPAYILLLPAIFCLFFFKWRPIAQGAYLSLFDLTGYQPTEFIGLRNYFEIVRDSLFIKTFTNTITYVLYSLVVGFLPPIFLGTMINELRTCKSFVKFSIYFPGIAPAVITSMLWTLIYDPGPGGLLNTILMKLGFAQMPWLNDANNVILYIIISMTWTGFGSACVLYMSTLQSVGKELYEAAFIDGAGILSRFRHITLPSLGATILLLLINNISGVFQVFNEPMIMTSGGPNNASVSLGLLNYRYGFVYFQLEKALATGMITFIILLFMTMFYFWVERKVTIDG